MTRLNSVGLAAAMLLGTVMWAQPVGAVRGQGRLVMNGRTVQDSRGATFLKVGDEVAVRTGKAVLDLVGGTKLYLEPGARVRLEPRGEGAVGVQMVAGQGAFRLGGGATMMGASGARQGLVAVERTLARVYPMVTMAPVAEAGGARGASAIPPMRSVDVSQAIQPPAPAAPGTVEAPAPVSAPALPTNVAPGTTYVDTSLFQQANGQTPSAVIVPGGNANIQILTSGSAQGGLATLVSRDDESLWWLAGGPGERKAKQ